MKGICQECKYEAENFTINQKFCSKTCKDKAKNKELMESWAKRTEKKRSPKNPWLDFKW